MAADTAEGPSNAELVERRQAFAEEIRRTRAHLATLSSADDGPVLSGVHPQRGVKPAPGRDAPVV